MLKVSQGIDLGNLEVEVEFLKMEPLMKFLQHLLCPNISLNYFTLVGGGKSKMMVILAGSTKIPS